MFRNKSSEGGIGPSLPDMKLAGAYLLIVFILDEALAYSGVLRIIDSFAIRSIAGELALGLPVLIFILYNRGTFTTLFRIKSIRPSTILWSILIAICMTPIASFVNLITMQFTPNVASDVLSVYVDKVSLLEMVFSSAIVPAVIEELAMRGVFLSTLKKSNRRFLSLFFCALVFGLLHGNINQFAYAFLLGFVFALIDEAVDSVLPSIIVHFWANASSIVLLYVVNYLIKWMNSADIVAELTGEASAAQTTETFGSLEEYMEVGQELLGKLTVIEFVESFIYAAIGGVLIFFIIRRIARQYGRWGYIKSIFGCKDLSERPTRVAADSRFTQEELEELRGRGLTGKEMLEMMESRENQLSDQVDQAQVAESMKGNENVGDLNAPKTHIINPLLILGIIVFVVEIVAYELVQHGIKIF